MFLRIVIIAVIVSHWMYTFPLRMDTLKPASAIKLEAVAIVSNLNIGKFVTLKMPTVNHVKLTGG
ncbi:hypothetical protein [Paenibacillus antarcticus]|uniref:hypothetical protein n=1 Tax=Paenibacillus antarcticus TaxID=253703 RepID=UPI001470C44D|nr:hypothetical protein [Paenibacillus antarcticus]